MRLKRQFQAGIKTMETKVSCTLCERLEKTIQQEKAQRRALAERCDSRNPRNYRMNNAVVSIAS